PVCNNSPPPSGSAKKSAAHTWNCCWPPSEVRQLASGACDRPEDRTVEILGVLTAPARLLLHQLPQDILQNPTVAVVFDLLRRVYADRRGEPGNLAVRRTGADDHRLAIRKARGDALGDAVDLKRLLPRQPEALGILPRSKLQRQHTHPNQIAAMDA